VLVDPEVASSVRGRVITVRAIGICQRQPPLRDGAEVDVLELAGGLQEDLL
jgi:hypothetical protein